MPSSIDHCGTEVIGPCPFGYVAAEDPVAEDLIVATHADVLLKEAARNVGIEAPAADLKASTVLAGIGCASLILDGRCHKFRYSQSRRAIVPIRHYWKNKAS